MLLCAWPAPAFYSAPNRSLGRRVVTRHVCPVRTWHTRNLSSEPRQHGRHKEELSGKNWFTSPPPNRPLSLKFFFVVVGVGLRNGSYNKLVNIDVVGLRNRPQYSTGNIGAGKRTNTFVNLVGSLFVAVEANN